MFSKLSSWLMVSGFWVLTQASAQFTLPVLSVFPHQSLSIGKVQESLLLQKSKEAFGEPCQAPQMVVFQDAILAVDSPAFMRMADVIVSSFSDLGFVGPGRIMVRNKQEVFSFVFAKKDQAAIVGELVLGEKPALSWCWILANQATGR